MPDFIYPKDYYQTQADAEDKALCFVLMPFRDEFRQVYDGALKPTVETAGLRCMRADDIYSPRPILVGVMEHIAKAGLVIADLTERNPNVFYELGIAHVRKENAQVILIAQKTEDVPFDLRHLRLIPYKASSEGLEQLGRDLTKTLVTLGLASPEAEIESLVEIEEEASAVDTVEVQRLPVGGITWSDAEIVFPEVSESFEAFKGRFAASLVEWFDYADIQFDVSELKFPHGEVLHQRGWPDEGTLTLGIDQEIEDKVDELIAMLGLPYTVLHYTVPVPFDPAEWVRYLKAAGFNMTFVSDRQITLSPDARRGNGFVDLARADDDTTVSIRAREGIAFQPKGGSIPYHEVVEFLSGERPPDAFAEILKQHLFG